MRLTLCLQRSRLTLKFKKLWKSKGVMKTPTVVGTELLKKKAVQIEDWSWGKPKPPLERWEPPVKDDPTWWVPPTAQELPNWNDEPAYCVYQATRMLEGTKQACVLSKSQLFHGMPEGVQRLVGAVELPEQDKLVQQCIMLSQKWNPTMAKLPRRFDKEKIGYHFNREYGIPNVMAQEILIRSLLLKCQSLAGRFPSLLHNRRIIRRPYLGSHFYHNGDKLVNIQGFMNHMIAGNSPLPVFGSEDMVDESAKVELPELWPVSPTNSVLSTNHYKIQSTTGFNEEITHCHPHLVVMGTRWRRPADVRNAAAIMYAMGYCLAEARRKFGANVTNLPEPISVQVVQMDFKQLDFIFFQLNTMNYNNNNGIKNFVWVDSNNVMFQKHLPQPWKGEEFKSIRYSEYEPEVFQKLLAMFLYGCPEVSSITDHVTGSEELEAVQGQ